MVVSFTGTCLWSKTNRIKLQLALLLILGFFSISLDLITATSASAAIPNDPQSKDTASWVNFSTINYGGKNFVDPVPGNQGPWIFTYDDDSSPVGSCYSTLSFASNPYANEAGTNATRYLQYQSPTEAGCIPSRNATGTITVGAPDRRLSGLPGDGNQGGGSGAAGRKTDEVVCTIGNALGWIVCPITEGLVQATITLSNILDGLLQVEPLLLTFNSNSTDPRAGTYLVWSQVRNLANLVLVFGFFAIVFSQATSLGLSSYGIKRMLPRLILVSIAINLSYYLCALLIDISNIAGGGIAGLFNAAVRVIPDYQQTTSVGDVVINILASAGLITAGVVVGGATVAAVSGAGAMVAASALFGLVWPVILAMLITTVLAFITAFLVVLFREVALVMLVIISPLAFAAWLLPNTENWFKRWRGLLTGLLIMYPLIMGIVYGSILSYNVLQSTVAVGGGQFDQVVVSIIGLLVVAMPLFSLPFLLKFAGNIGQKIGAVVNNPRKGPFDRMKKNAEERRDAIRANRGAFAAKNFNRNASGLKKAATLYGWSKRRSYTRQQQNQQWKANANIANAQVFAEQIRADQIQAQTAGKDPKFAQSIAGNAAGATGLARVQAAAMETLANEQTAAQKARQQAIDTIGRVFNGDHEAAAGWIRTRGGTSTNAADWAGLNDAQKDLITDIKNSGLTNVADSYNSALRIMAGAGYGTSSDIMRGFELMHDNGADKGSVNEASESIRSTYRSKGRGDLVERHLTTTNPTLRTTVDQFKEYGSQGAFGINWDEVKPESISRHALKIKESRDELITHLSTHTEYTRNLVAGLDNLADQRAKPGLQEALRDAWGGKVRPNGGTYSTNSESIIDELRDDYKLNNS